MEVRRMHIAVALSSALALAAVGLIQALPAHAETNLSGEWRLDPSRSDAPRVPGAGGEGMGRGGYGGEAGAGGDATPGGSRRMRGGRGGGRSGGGSNADGPPEGARRMRLPDLMHVTQTPTLVSFEDSTGAAVLEVATVPAAADTFARAPGARHLTGSWNGYALEIRHPGPRGDQMVENWTLDEKTHSLVSTVKISAGGSSEARTMRRVYRRVDAP